LGTEQPTTAGPIKVAGEHLAYADGSRYFMIGGNYFRGQFSDSITAASITADLTNAVAAGLNTIRVYVVKKRKQNLQSWVAHIRCSTGKANDLFFRLPSNTRPWIPALVLDTNTKPWLLTLDLAHQH
jgi:hypothetical protein